MDQQAPEKAVSPAGASDKTKSGHLAASDKTKSNGHLAAEEKNVAMEETANEEDTAMDEDVFIKQESPDEPEPAPRDSRSPESEREMVSSPDSLFKEKDVPIPSIEPHENIETIDPTLGYLFRSPFVPSNVPGPSTPLRKLPSSPAFRATRAAPRVPPTSSPPPKPTSHSSSSATSPSD